MELPQGFEPWAIKKTEWVPSFRRFSIWCPCRPGV